jgi:hypothetical protein
MARRNKAMSEKELLAQLDGQISDAESYSGSELSAHREKALKYYDGDMAEDLPSEVGRSSVVSQDVADHIGWLLPSLTRIFLAADQIGIYEPTRPKMAPGEVDPQTGQQAMKDVSEELAKQATDYVNYVLKKECNGYKVFRDAMFDGLLVGNGIIKHWWDATPVYETRTFTGLSEDAFALLMDEDGVEVLEFSKRADEESEPQVDPVSGMQAPQPVLIDVKIKRLIKSGQLRVKAVPGEDFLIEREATALNEEDCLFCAHRDTPTRSELILRYPKKADVIEELAVYTDASDKEGEKDAREPLRSASPSQTDHAAERVEVFECYVKVDYDGDGVAEWRQIVISADSGERRILANEEWGDELPFTDLVPDPIPHRWRGRSIFDDVGQVQRVKTRLERGELDNLYMTLEPNRAIDMSRVKNKDAALNLKLGEVIQTDGDPNAIIRDLAVPFVAKEAGPIKEYYDKKAERRTGVGERSAGLDKNALQSDQTATETNAMLAASTLKTEDKSRTLAETGMQRAFSCFLKLITRHQDKARMIRLRGKWEQMDPRSWDADMLVEINIGLGAGSPQKDMMALGGIAQKQELVIQVLGPFNEYVNLSHLFTTYRKMVETSGVKNPDAYFPNVSNEDVAKIREQQAQQPKPDPKMMEAQAKAQLAQQTAQADVQLAQQRAMAEMQLTREKTAADLEAQREAGILKMDLMREEAAAKLQLAREEAQVKAQLRREEMMLEAELTAQANAMNAQVAMRQADTNINRPGGE